MQSVHRSSHESSSADTRHKRIHRIQTWPAKSKQICFRINTDEFKGGVTDIKDNKVFQPTKCLLFAFSQFLLLNHLMFLVSIFFKQ